MLKRWPKRREFLSYYLLLRVFGCEEAKNLGELLDVLAPLIGSRRVSSNIIRHLVKQGFLERVKQLTYRVKCVDEVLTPAMLNYFAKRLRKQGYEVNVDTANVKIIVFNCSNELRNHPLVSCSS